MDPSDLEELRRVTMKCFKASALASLKPGQSIEVLEELPVLSFPKGLESAEE